MRYGKRYEAQPSILFTISSSIISITVHEGHSRSVLRVFNSWEVNQRTKCPACQFILFKRNFVQFAYKFKFVCKVVKQGANICVQNVKSSIKIIANFEENFLFDQMEIKSVTILPMALDGSLLVVMRYYSYCKVPLQFFMCFVYNSGRVTWIFTHR